jgi:hypothetical protein
MLTLYPQIVQGIAQEQAFNAVADFWALWGIDIRPQPASKQKQSEEDAFALRGPGAQQKA